MRREYDEYPAGKCEGHEAPNQKQDQYFEEDKAQSYPQQRGDVGQYLPQSPANHYHCWRSPNQDVDRSDFPLLP